MVYKQPFERTVLEDIEEQVQYAVKFGVRIRHITVRHDQVTELANIFVKSCTDEEVDKDDLFEQTVNAILNERARIHQLPIVVVGEPGNG